MAIHTPLMNVMVAAARKAGRALIRDFGEVENLQVSRKGPADFVSQADNGVFLDGIKLFVDGHFAHSAVHMSGINVNVSHPLS